MKKVWHVLSPLLFYYIVYNAVFLLLAFGLNAVMENSGEKFRDFLLQNAVTVNGLFGGLSMAIGVLPLIRPLREEIAVRKEGIADKAKMQWQEILLILLLAVTSSIGLNALISFSGLINRSEAFQEVSNSQFGIAFGIGIVLYGVCSPFAEEIVFRGLIYNRMRGIYPIPLAVFASGFIFGCYHGNLVQGIYGSCIGVLLSYLYERTGKFFVPVMFHGAANITIYIAGNYGIMQAVLSAPVCAAAMLAISAACIYILVKKHKQSDNIC